MKIVYLNIAICFCWSLFFGCKNNSVAPQSDFLILINLNDTAEVKVGQTVKLINKELVFRFDSLIQEGRCPIGIWCFWQGHASIQVTFPSRVDTLDTYFKPMIEYENYKIFLVDLLPYPVWEQPIDKNSYRAKIKVTQRN